MTNTCVFRRKTQEFQAFAHTRAHAHVMWCMWDSVGAYDLSGTLCCQKVALRTHACVCYVSVCTFVMLCETGARMVSTVPAPRYHGSGLFRHDVRRGQNHETEAVDPFGPTVHGLHRPESGRSDPSDRTLGRPRSHHQPWALCRGYFRGSPRSLQWPFRIAQRGVLFSKTACAL